MTASALAAPGPSQALATIPPRPAGYASNVDAIDDVIAEMTVARGHWERWKQTNDCAALMDYHHHVEAAALALEEAQTGSAM